jgi:hypothetical protein
VHPSGGVIAERVYMCETCGSAFVPARRDARNCKPACRQRAYRDRQRVVELAEFVWRLRSTGEITADEALALLIEPPAEVLERLGAA